MASYQGKPNRGVREDVNAVSTGQERSDIHTMMPFKVVKFYPEDQTADIQPLAKTYLNGKEEDLPVLPKVPISLHRSGDICMQMPIHEGDYGMVHFAERSIDHHVRGEDVKRPDQGRSHSLSDGIGVMGAYPPDTRKLPNYANDRAGFRNEDGTHDFSMDEEGRFRMIGKDGENMVQILDELLVKLMGEKTHVLTGSSSGFHPLVGNEDETYKDLRTRLAKIKP